MNTKGISPILFSVLLVVGAANGRGQVDLLGRYPTSLSSGDPSPDRARPWEFTRADLYQVSQFTLEIGQQLRVETGAADLGIGHCQDGAVWAVVIPRDDGKLHSPAASSPESIAHVWLRFHPAQISHIFPPATVSLAASGKGEDTMRDVADVKFYSSWHAGEAAMIPGPKDMTVDVDTKTGLRRFFMVDRKAQTAQYVAAFEVRAVRARSHVAFSAEQALAAFDQLWNAFDRNYASFVLRPEVDWETLGQQYRPKVAQCNSVDQFARLCADMLRPLRDLHVWLTVAGRNVPVFNRPRSSNSNPQAHYAILGDMNEEGRVEWAITSNKIGFLAINGWSGAGIPQQCDQILETMRETRGLILDVRLNGGGSEDLAGEVAGRFVPKEFVYGYDQIRNGPKHTDLTEKRQRTVVPRGPWRYNRPVVVLIGQKCMSSNESFVAMMSGDPDATIMGDHTCGSSGNPEIVQLPLDMTVSVPRWIDYLPDGTALDEGGFVPQVPFKPHAGSFDGERDDLLKAALERLSSMR